MLDEFLKILPSSILIIFCMITLLTVSGLRYSLRKTILIVTPFVGLLIFANYLLVIHFGIKVFDNLSELTIFLPEFILTIFLAKRKGLSLVVANLNAYVSFYMIVLLKNIAGIYTRFENLELFVYLLFIPFVTFYLIKFYNPFHDEIERLMPKFLGFIGIYSAIIFIEFYFYRYLITTTTQHVLRLEIFGVAIISVYIVSLVFFSFLLRNYREVYMKAKNKDIVDLQLKAMLDQYKIIENREKELAILRHDIKHILITTSTLIEQNQYNEALGFINSNVKVVESKRIIKYCNDPVINAIICYYKNLCIEKKIALKIKVKNIDSALKIKGSDLAILISNCFDNAINASDKLESNKLIEFKFINTNGNLVLQMKNNYNGKIILDKNQMPTSLRVHHGIGTQSIAAFCKENKLSLDYDINDTTFTLSILF